MNTFSTRTRRGAAILFSGVLVLGGLTLAGAASAEHEVEGNPTCADLGFTYTYKVESPSAGTYSVDRDGMDAKLTVGTVGTDEPNPNNAIVYVDIETSGDYAVIVKGGPGANVYTYTAPTKGATELHAPVVSSDKYPTISHFQLCWNGPGPQPELGTVEVTKKVEGQGAPTNDTYTICLEGPAPSDAQQCKEIKGAGTVMFGNLEPGKYVLTENDPGPNYTVAGTGNVTVVADRMTKATVTNTWNQPSEEFGRVEVTKEVKGQGAPTNDQYTICLEGPAPSDAEQCKKINGAGTVTFDKLAPGTYTVTENDPGNNYNVTISDPEVKVTIGQTATATVTNTWNQPTPPPPTARGRVEITKVVTGDGAPINDPYEICLRGPTTTTCKTIRGAGTVTFEGLVPGTYQVTETNPGTDYKVTITDKALEVTIGGVARATVTNEFIEQQAFPPTVPEAPTVPETPVTPEAPAVPQAPADVVTETALPQTGSEGGIAAVAAIVLASGIALTLLGRRRGAQQA